MNKEHLFGSHTESIFFSPPTRSRIQNYKQNQYKDNSSFKVVPTHKINNSSNIYVSPP